MMPRIYCTNEYKIDVTLQRQTNLQKQLKPLITTKTSELTAESFCINIRSSYQVTALYIVQTSWNWHFSNTPNVKVNRKIFLSPANYFNTNDAHTKLTFWLLYHVRCESDVKQPGFSSLNDNFTNYNCLKKVHAFCSLWFQQHLKFVYFGSKVIQKASNQKMLYSPISSY